MVNCIFKIINWGKVKHENHNIYKIDNHGYYIHTKDLYIYI